MKKIILSAAMALFVVAAYAQTGKVKSDASVNGKAHAHKGRQSAEVSGNTKSEVEFKTDDLDRDGRMSKDEKAARKARRDAERPDRSDDRMKDGSRSENNAHGKAVSEVATGTSLEGREKGAAVSEVARSKSEASVDGILTSEDKAARKEARRDEGRARKADRADDGLLNGSVDGVVDGAADANVKGRASMGKGHKGKGNGAGVRTGVGTKVRAGGTGVGVSAGKKVRLGL
jgi:hypothetical protein